MIPFNKPYCTGRELSYMSEVCHSMTISGNGDFTKLCQNFFETRYGFGKCLLCTSGTDALEMCAILCDLQPEDEVIVPSYTFVSSAIAFIRERATVRFADSGVANPNITPETILPLINDRTRAICVVHYAGIACDMDGIVGLAKAHNLLIIEDAAHAVDSYYIAPSQSKHLTPGKRYPLGGIGDLAAFSFHETKNISSGEGGMIVINNPQFVNRAEIVWEKGTDRAKFYRGMVDKYGWCDIGSSFLPSELIAAFLWAQVEQIDDIQSKRLHIWNRYDTALRNIDIKNRIKTMPATPSFASNNGHMYYLLCPDLEVRTHFINYMKNNGVQAVFHYLPLHSSKYCKNRSNAQCLENCERYSNTLVRLPLYYEMSEKDIDTVIDLILGYY